MQGLLIAVVGVLAVAGCSTSVATHDSPQALVDALRDAGVSCTSPTIDPDTRRDSSVRIICTETGQVGSATATTGDPQTEILWFPTAKAADEDLVRVCEANKTGLSGDEALVRGANWRVFRQLPVTDPANSDPPAAEPSEGPITPLPAGDVSLDDPSTPPNEDALSSTRAGDVLSVVADPELAGIMGGEATNWLSVCRGTPADLTVR